VTNPSAEPRPSLVARARGRAPRLLRENRNFRRYWIGQSISLFGDQITTLALPLVGVIVLHAGPAQMGYLTAAHLAPFLVFSLHAGAWVDRRGRRRQVMIAADLAQAVLLASIPLAYALGSLTITQLYVVSFATGTMTMLFFVSQSSLFVALAPRERYLEANSLLYGSRAFSFVGGPSVAGALVQAIKAPYALLVDAFSFLFSAWFLSSIAPIEAPASGGGEGQVVAGARFIKRSRTFGPPSARPRRSTSSTSRSSPCSSSTRPGICTCARACSGWCSAPAPSEG
jgi:MFS family permease